MEISYEMKKKAEEQAQRYCELMGGDNAKCGNDYDPWNLIGVSWRDYNDAGKRDIVYAKLKEKIAQAKKLEQDAAVAYWIKEAVKFRPNCYAENDFK